MTNITNIRLDKYLSQKFPKHSRAFLKQQINQGHILINGAAKKPSYILKPSDKIEIQIIEPEKSALQLNPNIKLNIVYEDENIIVIDKPAGISVHPAKLDNGQAQLAHPNKPGQNDTIANALLAYYPAITNIGDEPELRPGIVHRLDKDTSGLMVIAKNQIAFNWLKEQFSSRKVTKKYLALVAGNIQEKKGIISKPIGKTKDFRKRTTITIKDKKEAETHYKMLKYYFKPQKIQPPLPSDAATGRFYFKEAGRAGRGDDFKKQHPLLISPSTEEERNNYTLLEVEPKTGRTHQIRVHLASIGRPIAGDALYGFKSQTPLPGLKRQFLHASYLKFLLPNGKIIELKSELPKDLQRVLKEIKK